MHSPLLISSAHDSTITRDTLTRSSTAGSGSLSTAPALVARSPSAGVSREARFAACALAGVLGTFTHTSSTGVQEELLGRWGGVGGGVFAGALAQNSSHPQLAGHVLSRVLRLLQLEGVEDGVDHAAEPALGEAIAAHGPEVVADCVRLLVEQGHNEGPACLRLLGRSDQLGPRSREQLLIAALASSSADIRDAALQSYENWSDPALSSFVAGYFEPLKWLREYRDALLPSGR
jgi:hypothetical protein